MAAPHPHGGAWRAGPARTACAIDVHVPIAAGPDGDDRRRVLQRRTARHYFVAGERARGRQIMRAPPGPAGRSPGSRSRRLLAASRPTAFRRGVARVPVLRRDRRRAEFALLHASPRRVRGGEERSRAGTTRARRSIAVPAMPTGRCPDGPAAWCIAPTTTAAARDDSEPPLHQQRLDVARDGAPRLGRRGRGDVRATLTTAPSRGRRHPGRAGARSTTRRAIFLAPRPRARHFRPGRPPLP